MRRMTRVTSSLLKQGKTCQPPYQLVVLVVVVLVVRCSDVPGVTGQSSWTSLSYWMRVSTCFIFYVYATPNLFVYIFHPDTFKSFLCKTLKKKALAADGIIKRGKFCYILSIFYYILSPLLCAVAIFLLAISLALGQTLTSLGQLFDNSATVRNFSCVFTYLQLS